MGNPELQEIIDLATAHRLVEGSAVALVLAPVLLVLVGLARRAWRLRCLLWAAMLAPWALALPIAWRGYLWRVRYDPATGFVGLHSVRVLLENLLIAVLAGGVYGLYLRWLWGLPKHAPKTELATRED
ncbi:MAG: hypothetical protein N2512_10295 [Armatimonadetes bacterium]|nr:hypothetical protein [Armatimonadota bacterium]